MDLRSVRRAGRLLVATSVLAAGLTFGPLGVHPAGATISACGGCPAWGPIVTMDDGSKTNVSVKVNDSASDMLGISYVLHVPAGSNVSGVSYQGNPAVLQTIAVVPDSAPGVYSTTTVVTTLSGSVEVDPSLWIHWTGTGAPWSATVVGSSNSAVGLTLATS